jgi:hypothetical protein
LIVMRASEFFRTDQCVNEVPGDTGGHDAGEEIVHGGSHPRAGRDVTDREQEKARTGGQENKVEHGAPPWKRECDFNRV